jgi:hypothetical protein
MGDQAAWARVVAWIERKRNPGTAAPGFRRHSPSKTGVKRPYGASIRATETGAPCNNNEICNDPVVLAVPPEPLPGAGPLVPLDTINERSRTNPHKRMDRAQSVRSFGAPSIMTGSRRGACKQQRFCKRRRLSHGRITGAPPPPRQARQSRFRNRSNARRRAAPPCAQKTRRGFPAANRVTRLAS